MHICYTFRLQFVNIILNSFRPISASGSRVGLIEFSSLHNHNVDTDIHLGEFNDLVTINNIIMAEPSGIGNFTNVTLLINIYFYVTRE